MMGDWTFFSNHGHVFFCLARDGDARLRDVAADVGITERAVQKIVRDLQQDGYIEIHKQGRCNRYRINRRKFLRHPLESHCPVSRLVKLVAPGARAAAVPATGPVAAPEPVKTPESVTGLTHEAAPGPASESRPEPVPEASAEKPKTGSDRLPIDESPPARAANLSPAPVPAVSKSPPEQAGDATVTSEQPAAPRGPGPDGKKGKKGRKSKSKGEPIDVRKQGTLF